MICNPAIVGGGGGDLDWSKEETVFVSYSSVRFASIFYSSEGFVVNYTGVTSGEVNVAKNSPFCAVPDVSGKILFTPKDAVVSIGNNNYIAKKDVTISVFSP